MSPAPMPRSAEAQSRSDLRVAFFSDALPERNGAGTYYCDLIAQLGGRLARAEMFQPARKARLRGIGVPMPGDSTQQLITPNVPRLWRQFERLRPHVVVSVTPGPFGMLGLHFARRRRAGFLTGFHTHFERIAELYGDSPLYRAAGAVLKRANETLCRNSAAVLVNNPELEACVTELGAPRAELVGTPLAPDFLDAPPAPPEGPGQVVYAGRLAPEKNLDALVAAARAMPETRFVIAGDGPLRKALHRATAEMANVRFPGWLDRPGLKRVVDASCLLVLPSRVESFGTVALEAMARARPALVAAGAGIHRWPALAEGLFVLGDGEPLHEALRRLGHRPASAWRAAGEAARGAALELHRDTIEQWMGVVGRYAASGPRGNGAREP